ncbi:MAG: LemA family protein [Akkermansiaceae bacterium]
MERYVWVILAFLVLDLLLLIFLYNRLIRLRNRIREGWSGIEVQLKRRHDLIPSLVEVVKGFAGHEKEVLENVTRERTAAVDANGAANVSRAEENLAKGVVRLMALVEAYPDLKSDENFRDLMKELVNTEDELQYARRYYNGAVRDLNNAIESIPTNVVAWAFRFEEGEFFEVSNEAERMAPKV